MKGVSPSENQQAAGLMVNLEGISLEGEATGRSPGGDINPL
jgi:hypothetical protein